MDNLDEFLSNEPAAETDTQAQPETPAETAETQEPVETAEAKAERARDEKGRFAPKGEEEAAPPAAEETNVPVKALQEERRKRQTLEEELAAIRQRLEQPAQPAPSIWEDEQGWQQHFGGQVVGEAVQAATMNARLDMSEMMVRQSHPDFEDKKAVFLELMKETPGLQQKALSDPHPWNFAYTYVNNHQRMQELSATSVTELEAKLREQIKSELAAEKAPDPAIPDTLADAQSARGSAVPFKVPTLDEIVARR